MVQKPDGKDELNKLPEVGSKLRLKAGGQHKPQILHVRAVVDGHLVVREWIGFWWRYSVKSPAWWDVMKQYCAVVQD